MTILSLYFDQLILFGFADFPYEVDFGAMILSLWKVLFCSFDFVIKKVFVERNVGKKNWFKKTKVPKNWVKIGLLTAEILSTRLRSKVFSLEKTWGLTLPLKEVSNKNLVQKDFCPPQKIPKNLFFV